VKTGRVAKKKSPTTKVKTEVLDADEVLFASGKTNDGSGDDIGFGGEV
jgi:hypothetical protein|tara:strand:+ start:15454 stop:15597 length:144 start_codon:yes stop_codon:yes gene_type:complete